MKGVFLSGGEGARKWVAWEVQNKKRMSVPAEKDQQLGGGCRGKRRHELAAGGKRMRIEGVDVAMAVINNRFKKTSG